MDNWANLFSLAGKQILVTGASSGIGREIAMACSSMGADVILNGRNEERLSQLSSSMKGNNIILPFDLTDFASIPDMVNKIPKLDGFVHCAGIGERVLVKQLLEGDVDKTMDINFKAPVMLVSEILKQKKLNKSASVVFVASLGADSPSTGNAIYSASKGALISFAKCLMLELAPRQIRVNCISPGMVWTNLIMDKSVTIEQLKDDEQKYPLKRYGKPEDITGLAVYLLSDASAWMTGSNLKITGGAM